MKEIRAGDIVYCARGRDEGYFAVMRTEGKFCFLADGRRRNTQKPKKKNIKHVVFAGALPQEISERIVAGGKVGNSARSGFKNERNS